MPASPLTTERIVQVLESLGRAAQGPGSVFVCGGASAMLMGWRGSTIDIDLSFQPEPPGIFAAVSEVKRDLGVYVELAAPSDFVPALPGWRERSPSIGRFGSVDFFHYDFYTQAFAKLMRNFEHDREDVEAMRRAQQVAPERLRQLVRAAQDYLLKYPRLSWPQVEDRVLGWCSG